MNQFPPEIIRLFNLRLPLRDIINFSVTSKLCRTILNNSEFTNLIDRDIKEELEELLLDIIKEKDIDILNNIYLSQLIDPATVYEISRKYFNETNIELIKIILKHYAPIHDEDILDAFKNKNYQLILLLLPYLSDINIMNHSLFLA